jgi:hypothetical protein
MGLAIRLNSGALTVNNLFSPNARILGLPVWRKRLTDAEYIERVRKNLRVHRWLRIVYGVIGIGIVCILALAIQFFVDFLWQWGGQQAGPIVVFLGAILFGFNVGWMFMGFLHGAVMMIAESRHDRLLVECWDLLQQLIAERDAVAYQAPAPAAEV